MTIIGRKELIKIPIVSNEYMVAKIDTGAIIPRIGASRTFYGTGNVYSIISNNN